MSQTKSNLLLGQTAWRRIQLPSRVALMLLTCVICTFENSSALAQPGQAAPVQVAAAKELEVAAGVHLVGDIEPVRRAIVGSKEAGAVISFPHREGEFVKAGELIAQLETTVLDHELQSAKAMLDARKQELKELENGTRQEVVDAAKARWRAAAAMEHLAQQKLQRMEKLKSQSAASREDYDSALALAESSKADIDRSKAELDEAERGPRPEKIAQSRAMVLAQQAMVNQLQSKIDRHTIAAPFAGFITQERTQVGEWIVQGGPVVSMLDLAEVDVRVPVPSRYAGAVRLGQEVRIEAESAGDRLLIGHVRYIVPEVDLRSRLFPIRIRLANVFVDDSPILKAGMLAQVQLPVGVKQKGIYVPKDALVLSQGTPMVFLAQSSAAGSSAASTSQAPSSAEAGVTATPVPVRIGVAAGNLVEVKGQIKAGDLVVVQGNERLMPGQALKILGKDGE